MIIDVHGHYTTAPPELLAWRGAQLASLNRPGRRKLTLDDEQVAQSLTPVLAQMDARGIDLLAFSPRAAGMGHEIGSEAASVAWTRVCNDLVAQACRISPDRLIPVCQLPQSPSASLDGAIEELDRCVELGFCGCLVNPDVAAGGEPWTPSLGDEWWYPLWQRLVKHDIPAMIHASATRNPAVHMNATHYIAADLSATVELCRSSALDDFPGLKIIIPHGGGAVPFQFNRLRAVHRLEGRPPFEERVRRLYFDTAVYDRDSLAMLIGKIGPGNVVFGSEMFGTGKAVDPETGRTFDDNLPLLRGLGLANDDLDAIMFRNACRLFQRSAALSRWRP